MATAQEQQQGTPSEPSDPGDNLIRNPLDKRRDRDAADDASGRTDEDTTSGDDHADNLIRNPLDKPGADNLIDNPLDKPA